jgi:hypothetical protein
LPTSNERTAHERRSLATDLLSGWIKGSFIVRRFFVSEPQACSRTVISLARNWLARRLFAAVSNNHNRNSFEGYAAERISRLAKDPVSMPYGGPPAVRNPNVLEALCRHPGKIMVFSVHTGFSFIISLLAPRRKVLSVAISAEYGEIAHRQSGTTHLENIRLVGVTPFTFAKFMKDREYDVYCALVDDFHESAAARDGVKFQPFAVAARSRLPVYFAKFTFRPDATVEATLAGPFGDMPPEAMVAEFIRFQDRKYYPMPPD